MVLKNKKKKITMATDDVMSRDTRGDPKVRLR